MVTASGLPSCRKSWVGEQQEKADNRSSAKRVFVVFFDTDRWNQIPNDNCIFVPIEMARGARVRHSQFSHWETRGDWPSWIARAGGVGGGGIRITDIGVYTDNLYLNSSPQWTKLGIRHSRLQLTDFPRSSSPRQVRSRDNVHSSCLCAWFDDAMHGILWITKNSIFSRRGNRNCTCTNNVARCL